MGKFRFGPPFEFFKKIQKEFHIENFIETGTHLGRTASWASGSFKNVFTIESSADFYSQAKAWLAPFANVQIFHGDSAAVLPKVLAKVHSPSLFWLDGHWMGTESAQPGATECPLFNELEALKTSRFDHFLCIDDIRLFESTPHAPLNSESWPTIEQVFRKLDEISPEGRRYIHDDILFSIPKHAVPFFTEEFRELNTQEFKALKGDDHIQAYRYITHGLGLLRWHYLNPLYRTKAALLNKLKFRIPKSESVRSQDA